MPKIIEAPQLMSCTVACPNDYDYIYRSYRAFLHGVVYHSGVPYDAVEEATGAILIRMMAQDGLARFVGSVTENPSLIKAYLAAYFSLAARAEISRIRTNAGRSIPLDALPDIESVYSAAATAESDLLDKLLSLATGDAGHFIEVAAESPTYAKARAALVEEGWDSRRIRRAVKEAHAIVRRHLSPKSAGKSRIRGSSNRS
jgi:hypothetical protein